jgi:hypothetical protein
MQITAPTPIYYLPENLWSLLTRPGRELVMRVLEIEGKLLYLEMGGYKFQARLAGTLNPEDFRPGEMIKVRVLKAEGPVVLEILGGSKEAAETNLLYLLVRETPAQPQAQAKLSKELNLLSEVFKKAFEGLEKSDRAKHQRALDELLGKEVRFSDFVLEEDRLFLPFLFQGEKSWGYLEIITPEERGDRVRLFLLKLFFQYLGMVEALFCYTRDSIEVDFFFAEKKAWEFARNHLLELKRDLSFSGKSVKINLEKKEVYPGYFLNKVG